MQSIIGGHVYVCLVGMQHVYRVIEFLNLCQLNTSIAAVVTQPASSIEPAQYGPAEYGSAQYLMTLYGSMSVGFPCRFLCLYL